MNDIVEICVPPGMGAGSGCVVIGCIGCWSVMFTPVYRKWPTLKKRIILKYRRHLQKSLRIQLDISSQIFVLIGFVNI